MDGHHVHPVDRIQHWRHCSEVPRCSSIHEYAIRFWLRNLDADIVYLAVWPANLVFCTLFNTLHSQQYQGIGSRGGMTRQRFFNYVFCGGVLWCTSRILSIKFSRSLRTQISFLDTCLPHSPCFRGCVGSNQTTL